MGITAADLSKATELTRAGRLVEATRAIQAALGFARNPKAPEAAQTVSQRVHRDAELVDTVDVVDVPFRETTGLAPFVEGEPERAAERDSLRRQESSFTSSHFNFGADRYRYRVFVPARIAGTELLPVIVMLHGCKQNSDDFARGTGMNALAEREQVIVLYPEQLRKGNSMGCWNWFEPAHQRRDAGEPAMIALLARHVAAKHGGDPSRIYVAGLSAGAAMAAVLGELYPDVFAAVGAHSGLPPRAAGDVASAFGAMRRGVEPASGSRAVPTIVFHGTHDKTVAPRNGDAIAEGQLAAWLAAGAQLTDSTQQMHAGGRTATRTTWTNASGDVTLEIWRVEGGPHAWSGGHAEGSFTDPVGPSASEAMLRFFLQQRRFNR
jgi:poly(hydroxyalkanoate) depolymerase family esterase